MKAAKWIHLGTSLATLPVCSAQSSSANYSISAVSIDGGNGAASSNSYSVTASSIGGIYGNASSSNYELSTGPVGQMKIATIFLCNFASWSSLYFNPGEPLSGPLDDFDLDGLTNEEEFYALTDPKDASSRFSVTIVRPHASGSQIVYGPKANPALRTYRLLSNTNLSGPFVPVPFAAFDGGSLGGGVLNHWTGSDPVRFYRVEIRKP